MQGLAERQEQLARGAFGERCTLSAQQLSVRALHLEFMSHCRMRAFLRLLFSRVAAPLEAPREILQREALCALRKQTTKEKSQDETKQPYYFRCSPWIL